MAIDRRREPSVLQEGECSVVRSHPFLHLCLIFTRQVSPVLVLFLAALAELARCAVDADKMLCRIPTTYFWEWPCLDDLPPLFSFEDDTLGLPNETFGSYLYCLFIGQLIPVCTSAAFFFGRFYHVL